MQSVLELCSCPLSLVPLFLSSLRGQNKGGAAAADLSAKESLQNVSGSSRSLFLTRAPRAQVVMTTKSMMVMVQPSVLRWISSHCRFRGKGKTSFFFPPKLSLNRKSKTNFFFLTMLPKGSSRSLPLPPLGLFYGLSGHAGHCRPAVRLEKEPFFFTGLVRGSLTSPNVMTQMISADAN